MRGLPIEGLYWPTAAAQGAPPNGPFSAEGALPNQMNWPEAGVFGILWTQRRPKTPRTKLPVVVSSAAVGRFLFPRRSGWPRDAPPKKTSVIGA